MENEGPANGFSLAGFAIIQDLGTFGFVQALASSTLVGRFGRAQALLAVRLAVSRCSAHCHRDAQSTGMCVATQMPAPSNENPPPMLTVRFDCGTLAPGPKAPGWAHRGVPFGGSGGTTRLIR
jgi:hypothetical protein